MKRHKTETQVEIYRELQGLLHQLLKRNYGKETSLLLRATYLQLKRLVEDESGVKMPSLYSMVSFFGSAYAADRQVVRALHLCRKYLIEEDNEEGLINYVDDIEALVKGIAVALSNLLFSDEPLVNENAYPIKFRGSQSQDIRHWKLLELECQGIEEKTLVGLINELSDEPIRVIVDEESAYGLYSKQLAQASALLTFPCRCSLIGVTLSEHETLRCKGFVLLPDFLVDVTSVANCFHPRLKDSQNYLTNKLLPRQSSIAILKGNIVNYLLDRLIQDPGAKLTACFADIFQLFGVQLSLLDDSQARQLIGELKDHFAHIQQCITSEFARLDFDLERSYLEPTFYHVDYGLQGRLDLYFEGDAQASRSIIELKSGKPFMPNKYGLSQNHYVQTLLYDLLIGGDRSRPNKQRNFILYSVLGQQMLKFAPMVGEISQEALAWRNAIILMELQLEALSEEDDLIKVFELSAGGLKGFTARDIQQLTATYTDLDDVERAYYNSFLSFLTAEYLLGKVGHWHADRLVGQSVLWSATADMKADAYSLLSGLQILENDAQSEAPLLILQKTDISQEVSYFRNGDIVVLYPHVEGIRPDHFQITKARVQRIDDHQVTLRLRAPQRNARFFESHRLWSIEPDFLDSSFKHSYGALSQWAQLPPQRRKLILGRRAPQKSDLMAKSINTVHDLSEEQKTIVQAALQAEEYYLIWGPPGTGKTSMVLSELVYQLASEQKERVLVVGYTNRAVDEICEVIEDMAMDYLRIGSSISIDEHYHAKLLQSQMAQKKSRSQVKDLIQSTQIVTGTIASLLGKQELFEYVKFDRLIVDEASQILEPSLLTFLALVPKVILIGDHKQLPAVVAQDEEKSKIKSVPLNEIGLMNRRNSFFERLYKRAQQSRWDWCYGRLSSQGRMHQDICSFVSKHFYEDRLKPVPKLTRLDQALQMSSSDNISYEALASQRLLFINTDDMETSANQPEPKKSDVEARIVSELIVDLNQLYGPTLCHSGEVGIITAFRAQTANIRKKLAELTSLNLDNITIDTVERYQGGARDVIIYSPAVHRPNELAQIVSRSDEGVDRKLNVVLSRAREQVIIVGSKSILSKAKYYREFIESYGGIT